MAFERDEADEKERNNLDEIKWSRWQYHDRFADFIRTEALIAIRGNWDPHAAKNEGNVGPNRLDENAFWTQVQNNHQKLQSPKSLFVFFFLWFELAGLLIWSCECCEGRFPCLLGFSPSFLFDIDLTREFAALAVAVAEREARIFALFNWGSDIAGVFFDFQRPFLVSPSKLACDYSRFREASLVFQKCLDDLLASNFSNENFEWLDARDAGIKRLDPVDVAKRVDLLGGVPGELAECRVIHQEEVHCQHHQNGHDQNAGCENDQNAPDFCVDLRNVVFHLVSGRLVEDNEVENEPVWEHEEPRALVDESSQGEEQRRNERDREFGSVELEILEMNWKVEKENFWEENPDFLDEKSQVKVEAEVACEAHKAQVHFFQNIRDETKRKEKNAELSEENPIDSMPFNQVAEDQATHSPDQNPIFKGNFREQTEKGIFKVLVDASVDKDWGFEQKYEVEIPNFVDRPVHKEHRE